MIRLAGSVPQALKQAIKLRQNKNDETRLTLTLVLKRSDQNGFERFLAAVQDPTSPQFHQYLTQSGLAERFGPSLSAYDAVKTWLADEGFTILEDSGNRLTLTASATRRQIEETFQVQLENYRLADRTFHANNTDRLARGHRSAGAGRDRAFQSGATDPCPRHNRGRTRQRRSQFAA